MIEPRSMHDMTGWQPLSCKSYDTAMNRHPDARPMTVASALTDPDGIYGDGVIFTEWWLDDIPALRSYRWTAGGCEHYEAIDLTAAMERDDDY